MVSIIGQELNQYKILEQIGRGGMATVYRANQPSIDRDVAVKVLSKELVDQDESFLDRFYLEVKVISQLQHPHILPVYDFGEFEGQPYIVTAYVSGGTLKELINQGPMDLAEILRLLEQLANALDFAHGEGIIHRDFKPGNILLDEQGNTYLADFGLARSAEADGQLTGSKMIGTPDYMAPDLSDPDGLTPGVDVYALGITLYQMLTGYVPFQASTPMGVLMAHLSTDIPSVLDARPDLPTPVKKVVDTGMAKKVEDRYQSAGKLFEALKTAIGASEDAPSPLLFVNNQGSVIYLNNTMLRMVKRFESDARTIAGKPLYEVLGIEQKITEQLIQDVTKIGHVSNRPLEIVDAAGEKINVMCSAAATYDEKGKPVGTDLNFQYIHSPSVPEVGSELDEDDFTTGERSYIQLYFNTQIDALRVLLLRLGGPKLGETLIRILNETAERNEWPIEVKEEEVEFGASEIEAYIFNALWAKGISYAIGVIGVNVVEKQVESVDEQMGARAAKLAKKLGLKEIFIDQR